MKAILVPSLALFTLSAFATSPIAVEWRGTGEALPAAVARPFGGFLPDGSFLVAGGSNFENGKKVYCADIYVRAQDGTWKKIGNLPQGIAEGVTCETPKGIFCGGGVVGRAVPSASGGVVGRAVPSAPMTAARGLAALPMTVTHGNLSPKFRGLRANSPWRQSRTATRRRSCW